MNQKAHKSVIFDIRYKIKTMTLEARKLELVSYILQIENEALLDKVKSVFENDKDGIVTRTIKGKPLTASEYISELKEAESQIERGDYMTHEAVKKSITQW